MKRKIYLEGEIGNKFGKEFTMNVSSFGEIIRCLDANFSDFKKYLIDSDEKGIGFICQVAGAPLQDERELLLEYSEGDMIITAVPAGSGRGIGKFIAGVVLMVVGFHFFGPAMGTMLGPGGGVTVKGIAGVLTVSLGLNLALAGIQQMLAPDPSVDNDQDESYLFQGTGQTLIEGDPVPVLYGKLRVPGRPISLQVRNERLNYYDPGTTYSSSSADTANPIVVGGAGGGSGAGQMETEHVVHR